MSQQAGDGGLSRANSTSSDVSEFSMDVLAGSWEGVMQGSLTDSLQRCQAMLEGPSQLHGAAEQSALIADHGAAAEPSSAGLAQSSLSGSEAVSSTAIVAGHSPCPVTAQEEGDLSAWSFRIRSPHTPLQDQDPGAALPSHSAAAASPAFGKALLAHREAHGPMPNASPASAAGSSELRCLMSPTWWGEKPSACMLSPDSSLHRFSDSDEESELARLEAKYGIYNHSSCQ